MPKHAIGSCPRCGELFTCKVNSILKCDCMQIQLNRDEMQHIRDIADYDGGCLCLKCLRELKEAYQQITIQEFGFKVTGIPI
ncbi:MAG: cysteine-rich CWC family protein [Siphonobacter sp.]